MSRLLRSLRPSAQLLCRMSVTCICAVVAVLHPTARLAGPSAFLVLTTKDIVFPPSTNPSAQIEALAVNTVGVLFGLGWSNLGLVCATFAARKHGVDSTTVRTIRACFLVILAFFSGLARSGLPRLAFASRAAGFVGIWLLARGQVSLEWDYRSITQLLFVTSVAGAASLSVSLVARAFTYPGGYAKDIIDALELLKDLLRLSTERAFNNDPAVASTSLSLSRTCSSIETATTSTQAPSQLEALQKSCLDASLALHASYAYSAFEFRIGRVPVKDIKPLLTTVNRLRGKLAWGGTSKRIYPTTGVAPLKRSYREEQTVLDELDEPCRACVLAIRDGISVLQAAVQKCYSVKMPDNQTISTCSNLEDPLVLRERIIHARVELKLILDSAVHRANRTRISRHASVEALDGTQTPRSPEQPSVTHPTEFFEKSLYAASVLHMTSELIHALTIAHAILEIHRTSRPRLFFLRPSWLWLGMTPRGFLAEEDSSAGPAPEGPTRDADVLSVVDARKLEDTMFPAVSSGSPTTRRWKPFLRRVWNTPFTLRLRINLSTGLWKIRHSKHVHYAIKNTLGIGMLTIPAVLPVSSAGHKYFDSDYGVWAIISFMYVLEANTGLTWRIGMWRLFGTAIGTLYAYIAWLIVGVNPYGIVVLVTAAEIFLTWLVRSSTPGVGVVASVTIPPILFTPYLGLAHTSMIGLAALRGLQISIGIVAALVVTHLVFPKHSRVLFLSGMAQVLDELSGLYLHLSEHTYNEHGRIKSSMADGTKLELRLRELIARENVWLNHMEHEISLMPKPTRLYRASAECVQRITDLVSGLRRIRENVPIEAIEQVLPHRQHMVSCICLVLFACEHAFRSRRPLPQMLPSPRKALDTLSHELVETLHDAARVTDIGYAIAENEVLGEIVKALEVLIEVTRALFGTSAWLEGGAEISGSFGRSGVATPASIGG